MYTEINLGGPLRAPRGGGQNLKRKFKTVGFLDTLKVHIQSNYLTSTTSSPNQTKLAEKNSKLIFLILFTLQFQN